MEDLRIDEMICSHISQSIEIKTILLNNRSLVDVIAEVSKKAVQVYGNGGKIMLAGNGGSAADAQHIAGELVSRFYFNRPALSAIALTTDTSVITSIGNDYHFEDIFARQIEAIGNPGDLFIGISTSGNSSNIVKALQTSRANNLFTVGLTGQSGGQMADLCDLCIQIPSGVTPLVQEVHIMVGHIICGVIEEILFGKGQ